MRSLPVIESFASDTEQQFTNFVERHAVAHDALYEMDAANLPGDTVRVNVSTRVADDEVAVHRHVLEFMSLTADGHWQTVGCIGHSATEVVSLQGRSVQFQTVFEIRGPGIPDGPFTHDEVEPLVQDELDQLAAARLLPLRSA
ncbi:MAG TPA: hypothetical protein VF066_02395 [Thermoleophilaceae bacterium]